MNIRYRRNIFYHLHTLSFLLPWLVVFILFNAYPIIYSFYLSFTRYRASGIKAPKFIGVENYEKLLTDDRFLSSLWNSIFFVIGTVPLTMLIALVLAVALNKEQRVTQFYRISYFIPTVTSLFVTATIFIELYAPYGIINSVLEFFNIEGKHWLREPNYALMSIMVMNIWSSFGFYTILFLAALQSITPEYYEVSALEGASKTRQFFTITVPLLKPTIIIASLINTVLAFQVFGEVFIMTKGGPLRATETAVYYLYNVAFHKQKMGYASAAGYIIFAMLSIFTVLQIFLTRLKK